MQEDRTELLPLEGCSSAIWKYFGFPSRDGKFLEPDKRKRTSVNCKVCVQKCLSIPVTRLIYVTIFSIIIAVNKRTGWIPKRQRKKKYENERRDSGKR